MSAAPASAPAASTPRAPSAPAELPATLGAALPIFLRHASPRLLIAALVVALVARIAVGGWSAWDVAPLLGLLAFWPIQEWLIHVHILHRKPIHWRGRTIDFRVPRKHRAHHADPWRLDLVFIPVHSFAFSLPLVTALWWLATPNASRALTGICGHLLLALHYEWVHFLCHTRVSPRLGYYQRLVKHHRWHHFKNEHYWYGVTMRGGDRLLGTAPDPATVPSSPTARSLGAAG